jgi:hypothetical protein
MRGQVFKQGFTVAAESPKVPLEIVSNPTLLSDDDLFSEFPDFFTPPLTRGGLFSSLCRFFPAEGRQREGGRGFRIGVVSGLD